MEGSPGTMFDLRGVCDLRRELAERAAAEFGVEVYPSLEAALEDDRVEAIGLFTQPHGRAELIRRVLRAGKDVMTTKPFELKAQEAREAVDEAVRLGRVLHLNSPSIEPHADLALIKQWRGEHDLGRPVQAITEIHASYREQADGSWYDDPARCPVAPVLRLGIYLINDLVRLVGPARRVQVASSRVRTGRPTADNAVLMLELSDGCLATVSASFCVGDGDSYRNSLAMHFERGSIFRDFGPVSSAGHGKAEVWLVTPGDDGGRLVRAHQEVDSDPHGYPWRQFYEAVRERRPAPPAYRDEIVEGVRILEMMGGAQP